MNVLNETQHYFPVFILVDDLFFCHCKIICCGIFGSKIDLKNIYIIYFLFMFLTSSTVTVMLERTNQRSSVHLVLQVIIKESFQTGLVACGLPAK